MSELLTEEEAIKRSIELLEWQVKEGTEKRGDWPGWSINGGKYPHTSMNCFMCEYARQRTSIGINPCTKCPYAIRFGECDASPKLPIPRLDWSKTKQTKRKYAKILLNQVKQLQEELNENQ